MIWCVAMRTTDDELTWAEQEFGAARLGNRARTARAVLMAARAAAAPAGTVSSVFRVPAEREGAFRLLESDQVSTDELQRSARWAAARRCRGSSFVYAPVDQTSLNLTDRTGSKGFGAVGRGRDSALGLQVMTSVCVTPDGTPQGLGAQLYWSRPRRKKKRPQERDAQRVEEKETERWREVMRRTREGLAVEAPGTRPWFQLDRGGDAWPILDEFATDAGVELTIRASWDRRLVGEPGSGPRYLWATVERLEPVGDFLFHVPATGKRTERLALIEVRSTQVTLDLRDKRTGKRHPLTMWAVLAQEQGSVPKGERAIEWMLLTTHAAPTIIEAYEVIFGYSMRWRIECFHQTWKSGACDVESTQLRSVRAVVRWATLLASVAMRIQRLIHLSRTQPEQPATVEFTQPEIDAVIAARKPRGLRPGDVPPIVDVVRWIADEGGYTGKSSGGPPGAKVLARGLDRLEVLFRLFNHRQRREDET